MWYTVGDRFFFTTHYDGKNRSGEQWWQLLWLRTRTQDRLRSRLSLRSLSLFFVVHRSSDVTRLAEFCVRLFFCSAVAYIYYVREVHLLLAGHRHRVLFVLFSVDITSSRTKVFLLFRNSKIRFSSWCTRVKGFFPTFGPDVDKDALRCHNTRSQ